MTLRVVELFAGVGGFRIGLEGIPGSPRDGAFKVVYSNQWEPSTKKQHAAEVYASRWGLTPDPERETRYINLGIKDEQFVNEDITTIDAKDVPPHDLLCGGFPCQDYSVAKTLDKAKGLGGKKGVLWWEIYRLVEHHKPKYLLLENVDRLLKSPKGQRGRDFAVMLASLDELGYVVEWRVVDAAKYGFPQRRKRIFILAHGPGTPGYTELKNGVSPMEWVQAQGTLAKALPIQPLGVLDLPAFRLRNNDNDDLADVTDSFNIGNGLDPKSPFGNSGVMIGGVVWTIDSKAKESDLGMTLGDVLLRAGRAPDEYILDTESLTRKGGWIYLKGSKREMRKGTDGFTYQYSEGPITFPDALNRASRTIITGEGGSGPSRFKHVVKFKPTKGQVERLNLRSANAIRAREEMGIKLTEWVRRLTPIELERLNGFPDNHTAGVVDGKRAFFMGNALVVGIIEKFAEVLAGS